MRRKNNFARRYIAARFIPMTFVITVLSTYIDKIYRDRDFNKEKVYRLHASRSLFQTSLITNNFQDTPQFRPVGLEPNELDIVETR